MKSMNYQETVSNIQILENNLKILQNESLVKKPYQTIKTLFYNRRPKNRNNLKNLETGKINVSQINGKYNCKSKMKLASIESIINNSKNQEFLSLDHPNKNVNPILIMPIQNFRNQCSSSTLDSIPTNHNGISSGIKPNNISNNSRNSKLNKSLINDIQDTFNKKTEKKNLNDLYKEFIENVR